VADSAPPVQRLASVVEQVLMGLNRDPEIKELMLFESRRISKSGHMMQITQGFLNFMHQLDAMLERMRQRGELRPGLPVQVVRSALVGMCEGMLRDELAARHYGTTPGYSPADFRRILELFLLSLVPEQALQAAQARQ